MSSLLDLTSMNDQVSDPSNVASVPDAYSPDKDNNWHDLNEGDRLSLASPARSGNNPVSGL